MTQPETQRHQAQHLTSEFLGKLLVYTRKSGTRIVAPIDRVIHDTDGSGIIVSIYVRVDGTNATSRYDFLGFDFAAEDYVEIAEPSPYF